MKLLVLAIGLFFGVFSVCNAVTPEEFLLIKDSAEQGDADAQCGLGIKYASGNGVPEDDAEAAKWYRKAAEQGQAEAQVNLGSMYANGYGVPKDDTEAVKWYRKAAEQGLAEAQYGLGRAYGTGDGVPQDFVYAYKWFNLAAAKGNEGAMSGKEIVVENMTREQIAEAQKLSREWMEQQKDGK